mgnify:CR=1 FL=1
MVSGAPMAALQRVLRAAPPIGCGRDDNNVEWPCGVVVAPLGSWATLGDAHVITTRALGAFRPGILVSVHADRATPYHVLALQTAMNEKSKYAKYTHVYTFGIEYQGRSLPADGAALAEWMGGHPFEASQKLADALGPQAYHPETHRHVFFRM